ncbi:MAG: hypothetical protein MPN21_17455 [Thermoanaerobaculia bacterium]|nr:hypothetical protein [Thermoanaerobaculia bacterium]
MSCPHVRHRFAARSLGLSLLGFALLFAFASPVTADTIELEFPFEVDTWFDIGYDEGSISVKRVRVKSIKGNFKSTIFRANKTEFVTDVQIQVEYSNRGSNDVEALLDIVWVDSEGREIDGYRGEEDMDEGERDEMTAAISTSRYGLEVAKKLVVNIDF